MQRIALLLLPLVLPGVLSAQDAAGTQLWRVVGTTLAVPPALASGGTAAFWNPAQPDGELRAVFGLELIETPSAIGASGLVVTARVRAGRLGRIGALYGRMAIVDLVRTTTSPSPDGGQIPFNTDVVGATWSRDFGSGRRTTVGATLAHHRTRLDLQNNERWTLDVGVARAVGTWLRLSAATHFFSDWTSGNPAQDLYAGAELALLRGPLWGDGPPAVFWTRYGVAVAHGYEADHFVGAGLDVGTQLSVDMMLAREGGFSAPGWRAAGGIRVLVGKYRVLFARDVGVNSIGSAYRVGIEARVP